MTVRTKCPSCKMFVRLAVANYPGAGWVFTCLECGVKLGLPKRMLRSFNLKPWRDRTGQLRVDQVIHGMRIFKELSEKPE